MKKIITTLLFFGFIVLFAQNQDEKVRKHELSVNALDLVVAGALRIEYEYLFKGNQSAAIEVGLFENYGYYDVGYLDETNAFSLQGMYKIYFSRNKDHHGFFFYPLVRFRTGSVTVEEYSYSYNGTEYMETIQGVDYDIDGFSLGFGVGHKWLFNDKISLDISGQIARDLGNQIDDDYYDVIEPRFNIGIGVRF